MPPPWPETSAADVNEPGPAFVPHGNLIRVPVTRMKGLTERTTDRIRGRAERRDVHVACGFFSPCPASGEELEAMIRAGAFDDFGETRTRQFWSAQYLIAHLWRV